ncbi:Short-chain dehydrogenase TIC 32, chloroplastic [Orobanche minor]
MWIVGRKGTSGFSACSTAEEVARGIDGSGLTAIVTGSSSGIGAETSRILAARGVHVTMAVRNVESGKKVKEAIIKEIPDAKIDVIELDLSSFASVRKFASQYNSSSFPLNLLMYPPYGDYYALKSKNRLILSFESNNAGVMAPPFMLSQDNIELQFATNHLGHFLLTNLLLDKMKKTVRESHKEGRIIIVSSEGHRYVYREGIHFDKINDSASYNTIFAYGQSKLANILHANELARRLKEEGVEITANSLHPGAIATNLFRHHGIIEGIVNWVGKYFLKNIPQGAATTCYVALHPQVNGVSGQYFADSNIAKASQLASDAELANKLWNFSLKLTEP